jgi:hypothetical protein
LELILVVFALFALATPFATVFLLLRQRELRQRLLKLTELSMEVADGLRRDLQELKRQVETSAIASHSPTETALRMHTTVVAQVAEEPAPVASVRKMVDVAIPHSVTPTPVTSSIEKKLEVVAETREAPFPVATTHVPLQPPGSQREQPDADVVEPVSQPEQKPVPSPITAPPVPITATETKLPSAPTPAIPAHRREAAQPPSATPPPLSRREMPPNLTAHAPTVPPSPTPVSPAPTVRFVRPPSASLRSSASASGASTSGASTSGSLPASAAKAIPRQRMKSVFAMEEILGTNWLNKLGIVLVVFGVALFGIYELGQLGPPGKVGLSYAVSFALLGVGVFLEKSDRYRIIGHTLIGGGWALLFFTSYAMNHVQAMRVMSSESADLIVMLAVALAMVVHTLRYRSQLVTGLAFLLAYGTVALSNDDVYSLSSGVILAIGLVAIVIRMGWFELEVFGILSSYLSHAYWLYRLLGPGGAQGHAFPDYHASTAILLFYWLTYRISYVVRRPKTLFAEHVSTAAALFNTLLLLGVMKFQSVNPKLAFMALLIIGAAEFSFGQLSITRRRREAFVVLSVLGTALMVAAVPFRGSDNNPVVLWLIGAEVFLAAGAAVAEVVFRRLGLCIGLLVGLHLAFVDFPQLVTARQLSENLALAAGTIFGLCAVVFYCNALFIDLHWKPYFTDSPDAPLLCAHSYIGGFAAASAAWALCSGDWTALALAGIMLTLAALARRLKSLHLQVQYGGLGLLSLYRVAVVNLHSEVPPNSHITTRLVTLPILAAAFYLTAKFVTASDGKDKRTFQGLFTIAGTGLLTALIYYEVPELWQPLAAIAFAVLLLEAGQGIAYPVLAFHAHVLSGLAVLAAMTADQAGVHRWHDIPLHAFGALPVVAGAYWIARRIRLPDPAHVHFGRMFYSWVGTFVMAWVLYEAVPAPWIAVSWLGFAIVLALIMRKIGYEPLAWQANALAVCSVVRAYTFNLETEQPFWPGISQRLVTISIVAAGLYFLSRKALAPNSDSRRAISYLHTFAATALLALLAWHEAPSGWLAAVWAVFALLLALVDRRFELEDLGWQAHALAGLTMLRSVTVNLYTSETWHGISVRLLSLAIVAFVFYALSRIVRLPEQLRERDFHHIYSWAASALVSLLMWYELQPLSVAEGWAVFGLVLFEYGLWRKTKQFRFQAYVALGAAFGRIFFANLTAGDPGELWGPRMYTVLPITLILFFAYAQLGPGEQVANNDRRLHFDMLLAYLGTGTVVALLYFQFANEWLVTAWGIVVFALFGLSLFLDRPIFLHQGLLLTLCTCTRSVIHNLFGASYFTGRDWTGRYFVLGSAIAALLACLPFAFRWRDRYRARPAGGRIESLARHPEQFMFFAPVLVLTLMLAVKMRSGMVTVSWGIEGLSILVIAFLINERSYRLTGLLLLLVCFAKILLVDMWGLEARDRYITLIIVGGAILLASFLYTKYREAIRQYL